jgi:peptide/nickel transport system substrate-binding protein
MKKYLFPLAILAICAFILAGCSAANTTTKPPVTSPANNTVPSTAASSKVVSSPAPTPITASSPKTTSPAQYGGKLRIITYSTPSYLGDPPLVSTDSGSIMACIPALESLLFVDNTGQMLPSLAISWEINAAANPPNIVLHLRQGVKFQDGSDFNAQAVKWNMDRYIAAKLAPQWSGVDVIDNFTVRLNLKSFLNTILNDLGGSAGRMVSPTAAEKNGIEWIKLNPVGTGPFMFNSFSRDTSLTYTRFDNYWGGKPFLDGVQFQYVVNTNTAQLSFQSGEADVVNISAGSKAAYELIAKGYKYEQRPGPMMILIPDSTHTDSPLADARVRQALSYAVDRKNIVDTLGYGFWEAVNQPNSAQQFGHINTSAYNYDTAKARQLLADAGYSKGFTTTIYSSTSFGQDPLVAIQSDLAAIGITVKFTILAPAAWNDLVANGWSNGLLYVTQGASDVNYAAFLNRYYTNTSNRYPVLKRPAGLNDLILKALATTDYNNEKDLCQQAVKMLVDDCTIIPLFIQPEMYVLQAAVRDTHFNNLGPYWTPSIAWLSK